MQDGMDDEKTIKLTAEAIKVLKTIASFGGNLPDDSLTSRTGPNDAVARGQMYVGARNLALDFLKQHDPDYAKYAYICGRD